MFRTRSIGLGTALLALVLYSLGPAARSRLFPDRAGRAATVPGCACGQPAAAGCCCQHGAGGRCGINRVPCDAAQAALPTFQRTYHPARLVTRPPAPFPILTATARPAAAASPSWRALAPPTPPPEPLGAI
jgi:hypothetical protein